MAATLRVVMGEAPPSNDSAIATVATAAVVAWPSTRRGRAAERRSRGTGIVVLMSLLALPAPAFAQGPGDLSPDPAVNQYVESVPTAGGAKPSGAARSGGGSRLPEAVRQRVREQAGADADDLEAIATAPELGAPRERLEGGSSPGRAPAGGAAAPPAAEEGPVAAAVDAAVDGDGSTMPWLVAGLLATSALVGGAALVRRRPAVD